MTLESQLLHQLQQLPKPNTYWVALSGGCDSVVLLNALHNIQQQLSIPVKAIHIHHGLLNEADSWVEFCQAVTADRSIPLTTHKLKLSRQKGHSLEALARTARYKAIFSSMSPGNALLTAHHQDDQAETLLLQLLRGAGVAGLAAMPIQKKQGKCWHFRPLLKITRDEIENYARDHNLSWVDDPSNTKSDFDRNYLRNQVMPLLKNRWPSATTTISRSAKHCAEANDSLQQTAKANLKHCLSNATTEIVIAALLEFPLAQQKNILRQWLLSHNASPPHEKQFERIFSEVLTAAADASPLLQWSRCEIRRFQQKLYLLPQWTNKTHYSVEWIKSESGIAPELLEKSEVRIHQRKGGEKFKRKLGEQSLLLKNWFQQQQIPPWERQRLPLVYLDNRLVFIGEYLVAEDLTCTDAIRVKLELKK